MERVTYAKYMVGMEIRLQRFSDLGTKRQVVMFSFTLYNFLIQEKTHLQLSE